MIDESSVYFHLVIGQAKDTVRLEATNYQSRLRNVIGARGYQ